MEQTKTYSKNAHHMIMSYNDKIYHVDSVRVNFSEGKEQHDAVFHARKIPGEEFLDLQLAIPPMLCDVLIEYAKIDNPDAILVVNIKDNRYSWNVLSEAWLNKTFNAQSVKQYVA